MLTLNLIQGIIAIFIGEELGSDFFQPRNKSPIVDFSCIFCYYPPMAVEQRTEQQPGIVRRITRGLSGETRREAIYTDASDLLGDGLSVTHPIPGEEGGEVTISKGGDSQLEVIFDSLTRGDKYALTQTLNGHAVDWLAPRENSLTLPEKRPAKRRAQRSLRRTLKQIRIRES